MFSVQEFDLRAGQLFKTGEFTEGRKVIGEAMRLWPGDKERWFSRLAQISAREQRSLPPVGVHRDGRGPTTRSMFGAIGRAPEPTPRHACPGCTTAQIDEHQERCQACSVAQREPGA